MCFFDYSIKNNNISVLCFPYAGGGANSYSKWIKKLSNCLDVYPVHLPGREERIEETLYTDIYLLANDITKEILQKFKEPLVLFGHSMGGKLAYEVAKNLQKNNHKSNFELIVSGSRAPSVEEKNPIYNLNDNDFINAINRFGGTSKEVIENSDIIKFYLPILRADFFMDEKYLDKENYKISKNIHVFTGINDNEVTQEEVEGWNKYTDKLCDIKTFYGKHFFIFDDEDSVLDNIKRISNLLENSEV